MCLNYGNALECQMSKWYITPWTYKMICDIMRYPCESWTLIQRTRTQAFKLYKVQWSRHSEAEAT
jgi:hypothetical protein